MSSRSVIPNSNYKQFSPEAEEDPDWYIKTQDFWKKSPATLTGLVPYTL